MGCLTNQETQEHHRRKEKCAVTNSRDNQGHFQRDKQHAFLWGSLKYAN